MTVPENYIKTTCPRDCYDGCGIRIQKESDSILRVLGDPEHPVAQGALCQKCTIGYNTSWQDPKHRLLHPARRIGRKGSDHFQTITWEEALSEVAEKISFIRGKYTGKAITNVHYTGTCSTLAGQFPLRFFKAIGAQEVDGDTICNKAGHLGLEYVFGTSREGFDPRTIKSANSLTIWGCNPAYSAPRTFSIIKSSGIKTIVIDPIQTETAHNASIHLRPFPGSDAALAFGMVNLILQKGRADTEFIKKYVIGFEELSETIEFCTPARTQAKTGVPFRQIEKAVDIYLEGPSLLWLGQGLQRQAMGGNVMRSCSLLPIVTGNIGKTGTGFCFLNDTQSMSQGSLKPQGVDQSKISHMDLADHLLNLDVKCLFVWNMNPMVSAPRQSLLKKALEREDIFTIVIDCFKTKTTHYADILLPAATFLEFDDIVWNYLHLLLGFQTKAAEPMGKSLPNQEIFRRLAKRMRLDDPLLFESDADVLKNELAALSFPIKLDELKNKGWVEITSEPRIQFANLTFPTPSGKIEIASSVASQAGHPRCPFPHADLPSVDGLFRLLTPASKWILNSVFSDNSSNSKLANLHQVVIHSSDADNLNIMNGDILHLWNDEGEIKLEAKISDKITIAGVFITHKNAHCCENAANGINTLNPGDKTDIGNSSAVHGIQVFAKKYIEANNPNRVAYEK